MAEEKERVFLRYASPNERRTIAREDLRHYHAVIVAGIYRVPIGTATGKPHFFAPLRECIAQHPFLSVVVADGHSENPYYQRVSSVDLGAHIHVHPQPTRADTSIKRSKTNTDTDDDDSSGMSSDWMASIEHVLRQDLDRPFAKGIPPWRLVVLPLLDSTSSSSNASSPSPYRRYLIAFEYSHTIGDGPSGVAFHKTFYSALLKTSESLINEDDSTPSSIHDNDGSAGTTMTRIVPANTTEPFPEPFDTPQRLRISWGFLLGPLLAAILPLFIANLLGLKAQASSTDEGTWTGTPCFFDEKKGTRSKAVMVFVPPRDVEWTLKAARTNGARLTGVIHQLVVRSLTKALNHNTNNNDDGDKKGKRKDKKGGLVTNFVSMTPINMRQAAGVDPLEMGEFASGVYFRFPATLSEDGNGNAKGLTEREWALAREATLKFADAVTRLDDQPIGLLRYVPAIKDWLVGKLGKTRDASYEVSNLGVVGFGDDYSSGRRPAAQTLGRVEVEQMVFAQPGQVTSHPINFNVASMKTGGMVVTITWPTGSLGLQKSGGDLQEEEEEKFVRAVGEELARGFKLF